MADYTELRTTKTATIANGASLAGALDLAGFCVVGVVMPAAWTAANLTFQVSTDGTTYANLYDDSGNEVTATAAASRAIALDYATFLAWRWVKVRSGTSGAAVNQGGDRSLVLAVRPI